MTALTHPRRKTGTDPDRSLLNEGLVLHFFMNLSLAADVQEPLTQAGLGRPHHRILFFATHAPGITVNELLAVMRVTHQNLRLPMKTLVDKNFLVMRVAEQDRRQRQLHVTTSGKRLVERLTTLQCRRITRAFREAGPDAVEGFLKVQAAMIDTVDSEWVERLQRNFPRN